MNWNNTERLQVNEMAEKRMLTKKITDADEFISLPSSAQALYLHLNMSADDDGFNNQVQMAMYKAHASADDVKILLAKRFIIQFESGVIVIKHWRMANALRKDRYTKTNYQDEMKLLKIKDNGAYTLTDDGLNVIDGCQVVANGLPSGCQVVAVDKNSIDKNSIDKNSIDKYRIGEYEGEGKRDSEESLPTPKKPPKQKYGEYNHVRLTEEEFNRLCNDFGESTTLKAIKAVDEYCQQNGKTYKDYNLAIRRWGIRAANENKNAPASVSNSVEEMMRQAGLM